MSAPSTRSLAATLEAFRGQVNADTRLDAILRGWEPVIIVEVRDSQWRRHLTVRDRRIVAISEAPVEGAHHVVHLRSSEALLSAIFAGERNPTEAFMDGDLEVFANDKDQVKLDAISLVLWGA